jgi:hypothetical protein
VTVKADGFCPFFCPFAEAAQDWQMSDLFSEA